MNRKGFTLIEFLVVIGILAVLAVVAFLLLNPAEFIAQGRDSIRINDLKNIDTAIQLDKNSLDESLIDNTQLDRVYISLSDTNSDGLCNEYALPALNRNWQYRCNANSSNLKKVDSAGWIPINFTSVSTNPLAVLPVDPVNDINNYYTYTKDGTLAAKLTSDKYLTEVALNDGGNKASFFETRPIMWSTLSTPFVWVANNSSNSVTKLNSTGGLIGTYPVGGVNPDGIAVDASGNIWVTNNSSDSVTKLNSTGVVLGTYPVPVGSNPFGIAVDASGNVWVANYNNNSVTKLNSTGGLIGTYPAGTTPDGIAVDASGNVWVTNDMPTGSVTKLNSTGGLIGTYPVGSNPRSIAVDASGNIWVANVGGGSVTKLNSTGGLIGTYPAGTTPVGIAVDASGNIWVTNMASNSVTKLNSTGGLIGTYPVGGVNPYGIAVDASGNIWVTNNSSDSVTKLNSTGVVLGTYPVELFPYSLGDMTGFALQYFVLGWR